ncbi:MAG: glycosyltransferase family 2 protein [Prevotella sp.]|jgi:glycosyltransferase involved in cell wall biosynthesis|nr:glycosyltransferase family 2 protein [Prevotella sp.]
MIEMPLTIVTPSYNRAKNLPALYHSLLVQTSKDFDWLIIDDGSQDNTKGIVDGFSKEERIPIRYIYKENGGKHSALNVAFREVKSELLFIVDSDDVLTSDAVETILKDWASVRDKNLCGVSYLRGYSETEVIGDLHPNDYGIDNFINLRFNNGVEGDKAEVWRTECLRDFQFPEYPGERFISESVAWIYLAKQWDILMVNKIIYITEYLEGGLSDNGRKLRFQCPNLMTYGSLVTMSKEFSAKIRIKETLLYIVYSKFGKRSFCQMMKCPYKELVTLCYLPGLALYHIWKKKYNM